jgi:NAD(P)-dependent dehydrogenase (short-subunit alcohol dehydrogenase family)
MLAGKVIIVTGAARGIGAAAAYEFLRLGAKLALADCDGGALKQLVDTLGNYKDSLICVETDVSDPLSAAKLVEDVVGRFGQLDGAFNNAGIDGALAPLADYPEADFDRVIAVNLKGVWNCMCAEIPAMLESGGGAIVNNASALSVAGEFNMAAYCASKAGVLGLTRVAALDYGKRGIRVNALSPGVVRTPMMNEQMANAPGFEDVLIARHPLGRLGSPDELAKAAAWMLSDNASFMTGTNVSVDGGYLIS